MTSILFVVFIVSSTAAVIALPVQGVWGAVILGVDVIIADLLLQWLRFKYIRGKEDTKKILVGILGGLTARILLVLGFIRLGMWRLGFLTPAFYIFVFLILTVPVWSVLLGLRLKKDNL